jgi:hypothetical protein
MDINTNFLLCLSQFFLEMKDISDKVVEEIKAHILLNFFPENSALYEIKWKNILEPVRPQMAIWHMLIACGILEATNTG